MLFFLDKSRKTSVLFSNTHGHLLKIGKLIGSALIQTKAAEFKGHWFCVNSCLTLSCPNSGAVIRGEELLLLQEWGLGNLRSCQVELFSEKSSAELSSPLVVLTVEGNLFIGLASCNMGGLAKQPVRFHSVHLKARISLSNSWGDKKKKQILVLWVSPYKDKIYSS